MIKSPSKFPFLGSSSTIPSLSHKKVSEFHWIKIYLASQPFHPTLNRHTACKSRITSQIRDFGMKNIALIFIIAVSLPLNSREPIVLKDYPATSADEALGIVIMGALMMAICCVISVTDIALEGVDLSSGYCLQ